MAAANQELNDNFLRPLRHENHDTIHYDLYDLDGIRSRSAHFLFGKRLLGISVAF